MNSTGGSIPKKGGRRKETKGCREVQKRTQRSAPAEWDGRTAARNWLILRPQEISSSPSHAHILEPHSAQAHGVEQVFCVHNHRLLEQVLNALKIQRAELRPTGAHN